jgi:hypothetical protein
MKIILNKCYGGFGISLDGYLLYAKKKGIELDVYHNGVLINNPHKFLESRKPYVTEFYYKTKTGKRFYLHTENRDDETLIKVVKELGEKANGIYADLKIVEIPDNMQYSIEEYDGIETLHEYHNWW